MPVTQVNMTEDGVIKFISLWHPIDGKWRHITQVIDGPNVTHYTDGVGEKMEKKEQDGA